MSLRRAFSPYVIVCSFALAAVLFSACGDPPTNEMQQAQGAIDAARAAGADKYAHDELTAAETALANAERAVTARDYRLALTHALDSRERARNAARQAADGRAALAETAVRALSEAEAAIVAGQAALTAAERAGRAASTLSRTRRAIATATSAVQKARAAFGQGDFQAVSMVLTKPIADLQAVTRDLTRNAPPASTSRR